MITNRVKFTLIAVLISIAACSKLGNHPNHVKEIQKYEIYLPEDLIANSGGFHTGIGSGLEFNKKLPNGNLEFFGISDRGPNYAIKEGKIVSLHQDFSPLIVRIEVTPMQAYARDFLNIKLNGKNITGFNANRESSDEKIYNNNLQQINPGFGLDTEGMSIMKNGHFVISDEYYPSINIVDNKTGEIIRRLVPGDGLPENFNKKNFNRGIESVTVAPNGKIYAIMEGVLNIDNVSAKKSKLIRMIEIDLDANNYRVFAYPFDYDKYKDSSKVKIGDIAAIDNYNFLITEQGPTTDGQYRNIIYNINIKDATDIKAIKLPNGAELESADFSALNDITFIEKKILLNPREHGWTHDKLEGIAIVNPHTIAITNDNDFAITGLKLVESCKHPSKNHCQKVLPIIDPTKLKTHLWIISFKSAI